MPDQSGPTAPPASSDAESTFELLGRARTGDEAALNTLIGRYLPALRRWAHGRLPGRARGIAETEDLVQESVTRAFSRLEEFEHRGSGALFAYLRQAVLNRLRDEIRRADRRPLAESLDSQAIDPSPSPLDAAIGSEAAARYDAALGRLRSDEREAVVGRLELGCSYEELAQALGKPSADAARMAVTRALVRLAEEMGHGG
jgi:RNA polymerase sigma-70 factor (ECF subfamily)